MLVTKLSISTTQPDMCIIKVYFTFDFNLNIYFSQLKHEQYIFIQQKNSLLIIKNHHVIQVCW